MQGALDARSSAPLQVLKTPGPLLLLRKRIHRRTRLGRSHSRPCPPPQAAAAQAEAPEHLDEAGSREDLEDFKSDRSHETDYVVVGSGIGGLCCAALLARYGNRVTVCESHYHPGGAAQSFEVKGHHFDGGPSFFAGLTGAKIGGSNPLKQVLDAIGESVDCVTYDRWMNHTPNGSYATVCDGRKYAEMIREQGGEDAARQWAALERELAPLGQGAALFPAAVLRFDPGVAITAARLGPSLLKTGLQAGNLTAPFAKIVDKVVKDPWLRRLLDLECFVLSGMLAKDTICAEMAFMLTERNSPEGTIDYPKGGTGAIVDALIRGLHKHGGSLLLRAHVDQIIMEGGKAAGIKLRPKNRKAAKEGRTETIRARKGVISNVSIWDTPGLLPDHASNGWQSEATSTPQTGSFMHLHLGFNSEGLSKDVDLHHLVVNDWDHLEAPQNVCIVSIPTQVDPSLAPPGQGLLHAYTAGNEPWHIWEGMDRRSKEYKQLKEERIECLWKAIEHAIPDIRERANLVLPGSPITHQRYLNRSKGTYGAAISAATGSFPGPQTPIKGLYRCGDSTQPGIGVPAAAASGMICANTLVPVWEHLGLLNALKL